MMLLYIQMFTKLGDDFGAQLLEGDREKHIQDIVTMFSMVFLFHKNKRHPYVKYI